MTNRAEFERLLDVYGFRCERFGQDLSTHARAQVVSAFAALASAPVAGDAAYIAQLRAALILSRDSHGVSLLTDPPQDAWKARHVDEVIRAALPAGQGEAAGGGTC